MNESIIRFNHFIDPKQKDSAWAAEMMFNYYHFGNAENLLAKKDAQMIASYAAGEQDMRKFKRMFKRLSKEIAKKEKFARESYSGMVMPEPQDITGIDWEPLGFLTQPFNSALSVLQKQPLYVKCTAVDALAREKKEKDYNFYKNRPYHDSALNDYSQKLGSNIAPPNSSNNAENVDIANFDLDPTKDDELNFYFNLFYKLRPESAFEALLSALAYIRGLKDVRDLEAKDQLFYGCSSNRAYFSELTGLPDVRYVFPGNVWCPPSDLPDKKDNAFRFIKDEYNASEIMDLLGEEMTEELLTKIFETYFKELGMSDKWKSMSKDERRNYKIPLCYFEFKSWDIVNFRKRKSKSYDNYYFTEFVSYDFELRYAKNHPDKSLRNKQKPPSKEEFLTKRYIQQTYCGYWFPHCMEDVYKYKKLEGAAREKGKESLSQFSINVWVSQPKGPVEQCISIVDNIQRADIKMQHAIIMAKPKGMYIDMRYMRQALANAKESDMQLSMSGLMTLLTENNIFLGDSEGIEPGELQSGARPFYEIPGGPGEAILEYIKVKDDGLAQIARITGWNDALTGNTPSQDSLVGVQKLLLQSGINALYPVQNAMKHQTEAVYKTWAYQAQYIAKYPSSESYKTLEAILSAQKMQIIKEMENLPLHQFGIMVENAPTEEAQQELNNILLELFKSNIVSPADVFTIKRVFNYKDAQQLLAIRDRKARERMAAQQQADRAVAIQQTRIQAQQKQQAVEATLQNKLQDTMTKGEIQKWLAQYNGQLQEKLKQLDTIGKLIKQREQNQGARDKITQMANVSKQRALSVA